jgi:hypothetical protein
VDEPSDESGASPIDNREIDDSNENEKREPDETDQEQKDPAPDEQALEHAQEPPD